MKKRKICVVTGTRAEYGLLYWLMREIQEDPDLELQIIVTGMHLSPEFGLTYKMIEEDGFHINEKVEMLLSSDTPVGISKSIGLGIISMADALDRLKPEIVVILGDRFEILAVAQAAMTARIPIAHIHGGETTEGAIDEQIRHALTKMSHLHFVAAEPYRKRVIQMGESPDRVYNVGALGLDNIKRLKLLSKNELEQAIDFSFGNLNFLVTLHPVTLNKDETKRSVIELLKAIQYFPEAKIIFTKSNADTDGHLINQLIDEYARKNQDRVKVFASLGQVNYLSTIQFIDVVIGNSSSGIIEVPVFKKPTVNIGTRQKGRLKASSVIDCEYDELSIKSAIEKALSPEFQKSLPNTISLYGSGNTAEQIKDCLKSVELRGLLTKKFYDLM
jgi:UDP-hydrolysing UDP-N-acetyl-D-glucosamine 2-epimerase